MLQPKIVSVQPLPGYKLDIRYENGEKRLFEVSPYIRGDWYGKLKEFSYFRTVHILPSGGGIEWAEGQDIAPHELYEMGVEV
ncbi:hypothetical protein AGMMS50276_11110 [Synergistales bacterium]|nr:hypothetical protein AGMMS50276_11110 [Synergistales bacterium]